MKNLLFLRGNCQPHRLLVGVVFLSMIMLLAAFIVGCDKEAPLAVDDQSHLSKVGGTSPTQPLQVQAPVIASVREIGAVGKPASVTERDGGASAIIGGKLLWYFGDTIFNPKSVDGTNLRSNTAALANPASPLVVSEPVDVYGAPYPFVPFTAAEQAYNDSTAKAGNPNERYALWPGSVIPDGSRNGLVFYTKWKIHPCFLCYEFVGTGLAQVKKGKTVATRLSGLLFTAPEPNFDKAYIFGSNVYVYGSIRKDSVGVARVPLKQVKNRAAYSFYDDVNWVANVNQAKQIMYGIPGAVSVSYNAYLKQYLAIHGGKLFSTINPDPEKIYIRTANSPEGPWSLPVEIFTGRPSSNGYNRAAREHPELAQNNGQTIFITYFNLQGSEGELYLVEVTFK